MRKASLTLGIIGSCFAVFAATLYILLAVLPVSDFFTMFSGGTDNVFGNLLGGSNSLWYATGITGGLACVFGVISCVLLKKHNKTAGVLFILSAVLAVLSSYLVTILYILSGIFALVKAKPPVPQAMGPYAPYPAYGAYPPPPPPAYGAYPQPPYPPYGAYGASAQPGAYPPPYGYPPAAAPGAFPPPPVPVPGSAYPPPPPPPPPPAPSGEV
jgi:hypothetical protein